MSIETDNFIFTEVQWIEKKSREVGRNNLLKMRVGIKSASVFCSNCNYQWATSEYGEHKIIKVIGGLIVTCPSCGTEEKVSGRYLKP